jgi:RNA polymerase sigma factor (sigma-70 family)
MVLGLCRRLLRHDQDAEDAFQATFLTLARKAATISKKEALPSWLYKVAYRVAGQLRRREVTNHMAVLGKIGGKTEGNLAELRGILDEEIASLPEAYRRPILLCHLQGKTVEEAARLLSWPRGTVASRLARAKEQLRRRLTRRGWVVSTAAVAAGLSDQALAVPVAPGLVRSTMAYVSKAGGPFTKVLALSDGVLRMLWLNKLKMTAGAVLALVLAGTGVGLVVRQARAADGAHQKEQASRKQASGGEKRQPGGDPPGIPVLKDIPYIAPLFTLDQKPGRTDKPKPPTFKTVEIRIPGPFGVWTSQGSDETVAPAHAPARFTFEHGQRLRLKLADIPDRPGLSSARAHDPQPSGGEPGGQSIKTEERFFQSGKARLRYLVAGQGEPVILIHGWAASATMWDGLIPELAREHQVIALDCRGHGKSDKPHDPELYGLEMVNDVVRLIDHLGLKRAHIVGYSMGGSIALKMLVDHPGRFLSVVIGGSTGFRKGDEPWDAGLIGSLETGMPLSEAMIANRPPGTPEPSPEQREMMRQMDKGQDSKALAAQRRGNAKLTITDEALKRNKVPALVIYGSLDGPDRFSAMKKTLASAQFTVVEGAGHASAPDRPAFIRGVREFLALHKDGR